MDTFQLLRQYRIGPFTVFDSGTAFLGVGLLSPVLSWAFRKLHIAISFLDWMLLTFPLSVLFHIIFHQNTPLMRMLFGPDKSVPAILAVAAMVLVGFGHIIFSTNRLRKGK
jgi:hypothetical protein